MRIPSASSTTNPAFEIKHTNRLFRKKKKHRPKIREKKHFIFNCWTWFFFFTSCAPHSVEEAVEAAREAGKEHSHVVGAELCELDPGLKAPQVSKFDCEKDMTVLST